MTGGKVLIAEDEPHIVESLRFVLGRAGFEVSAVEDGEAALHAALTARPDLLILDVMLPKMTGFDVLRRLRAEPGAEGLAILMLTAKGQSQDRRAAEELGADAFVTKPFSNREVVDRARDLIAARQAAR